MNLASNIIRLSLPDTRRARHEQIGNDAEDEVAYRLCDTFGERRVDYNLDFRDGTNGYPDIQLRTDQGLFYIEVKSAVPFVRVYGKKNGKRKLKGYRPNSVKWNRKSWELLKRRAKGKRACIILVIQIRLQNTNIHFMFDSDLIQSFFDKTDALWVHIPLSYIFNRMKTTEFQATDFVYKVIETKQDSLF